MKFHILVFYKKKKYIERYNISIFNSNSIDYNNNIHIKDEKFDPLMLTKITNLKKMLKNQMKQNILKMISKIIFIRRLILILKKI